MPTGDCWFTLFDTAIILTMEHLRYFGFLYAAMFFFVAFMGYIPQFLDGDGYLFGLFALDIYDNLLHAFSGIWILLASFTSLRHTILYFTVFGTIYFLDGMIGLVVGNAFLDFSLFKYGIADNSLLIKFLLNVPHIIIGGTAMIIGFYLSKKPYFNRSR